MLHRTPWHVQKDIDWAFSDADNVPVGECYGKKDDRARRNAAFIVECVNINGAPDATHYAISVLGGHLRFAEATIEAFKSALKTICNPGEGGRPGPDLRECIRIARDALAASASGHARE